MACNGGKWSGSLQCESMWSCALRRPPLSSTLIIHTFLRLNATWAIHMIWTY